MDFSNRVIGMAPTTSVDVSFRDLLNRLVSALASAGPDSAEVAALVQLAKAIFPQRAAQLDTLVGLWRDQVPPPAAASPGPVPSGAAPVAPPTGSWTSWLAHGGTMTLGALLVLVLTKWDTIQPWLEPLYRNPTATGPLLALIVVGGGVGGLLNGYLTGTSGYYYFVTYGILRGSGRI